MVAGGGALEAYFEIIFSPTVSSHSCPESAVNLSCGSSGRSLNLATTAAPPRPCVQWSAVRIKRKFCEGVLVTKVCSVFLIAALLRASTLHVASVRARCYARSLPVLRGDTSNPEEGALAQK